MSATGMVIARKSAIAVALLWIVAGASAQTVATDGAKSPPMKIRVHTANTEMVATLADNPTARDLRSLLPLKLKMSDLFRREKVGHLPRPLAEGGRRKYTYKIGEIIYWSPGPHLAIYYRDDGERIPSPGIIVLGQIESGAEALLDVPGSVDVTIEPAD